MPITSSEVTDDRQQSETLRSIKEKHTDHLGFEHFNSYTCALDYDAEAALIGNADSTNENLIAEEIAESVATYEAGGDPLHYEASSNNWQKITPNHQTWDELASPVLINFLSRVNRNELHYIETTIIRISSQDKKALLGMTNQEVSSVNADIQMAVDSVADLASYSPYFVDGVKV